MTNHTEAGQLQTSKCCYKLWHFVILRCVPFWRMPTCFFFHFPHYFRAFGVYYVATSLFIQVLKIGRLVEFSYIVGLSSTTLSRRCIWRTRLSLAVTTALLAPQSLLRLCLHILRLFSGLLISSWWKSLCSSLKKENYLKDVKVINVESNTLTSRNPCFCNFSLEM